MALLLMTLIRSELCVCAKLLDNAIENDFFLSCPRLTLVLLCQHRFLVVVVALATLYAHIM